MVSKSRDSGVSREAFHDKPINARLEILHVQPAHVRDCIACLYTRQAAINRYLSRRRTVAVVGRGTSVHSHMCPPSWVVDHINRMINLQTEALCCMNWWMLLSYNDHVGLGVELCSRGSPWYTRMHDMYNNYGKSYDSLTRSGTSPVDGLVWVARQEQSMWRPTAGQYT
jgi:hypothetical protein